MSNYEDLMVWQEGLALARRVIGLVKRMSPADRYAMGSQLVRAAVSIPANLAEGSGRSSRKEMIRFTRYSIGSLYELETQMLAMNEILPEDEVAPLLEAMDGLAKGLSGLVRSLGGSARR